MMKRQPHPDNLRWQRTLRSREAFADDLGMTGASVGPRTGPNKRTQGEKEDYILRRLLTAWKLRGHLHYPLAIYAHRDVGREPDFILGEPSGESLGIEITEAGEEKYQEWLTHAEPLMATGNVVHVPFDASTERTAQELVRAISRKVERHDTGHYRGPTCCHLVVYDNTSWGGFLDKSELVSVVRAHNELAGRFAEIHVVFNQRLCLDIFGRADFVDVSESYETDVSQWAFTQARKLREGRDLSDIDKDNIAGELEDLGKSERRALASHIRILLIHLLKYEFQPKKRSASWMLSIENARAELDEVLTESPSLRADLLPSIEKQYQRARKQAAAQTKLDAAVFPEECPYSAEQLLDDDYLPGERK